MDPNYVPKGWEIAFKNSQYVLAQIYGVLKDREFYPAPNELYRALDLVRPENVRVVIFGQDPYPGRNGATGKPNATGMAFSVRPGDEVPKSLLNILSEVKDNCPESQIVNGDLTRWAEQGVLLLNSSFTVAPGQAGSHIQVWRGLVINILKQIGSINRDCIYVMWGAEAKKMREFVVSYSLQLEAPHPSPRAGLGTGRVFRGCRHFVLINQHLVKIGQKPIDWSTGQCNRVDQLGAGQGPGVQ